MKALPMALPQHHQQLTACQLVTRTLTGLVLTQAGSQSGVISSCTKDPLYLGSQSARHALRRAAMKLSIWQYQRHQKKLYGFAVCVLKWTWLPQNPHLSSSIRIVKAPRRWRQQRERSGRSILTYAITIYGNYNHWPWLASREYDPRIIQLMDLPRSRAHQSIDISFTSSTWIAFIYILLRMENR